MINIEFNEEGEAWIGHFAQKFGLTVEEYVKKAIQEYTEDQEDIEAAVESLKDPGENLKHEEVMARHDLAH